MKILLSPAKALDYKKELSSTKSTKPIFIKDADKLNNVLQKKSPRQLANLMNLSDKLAELNWQRNQDWSSTREFRQAVFAFNGGVYAGLDAHTIPQDKMDYLTKTLRILSGKYGLLKPLDRIKPYRLEMGTRLSFNGYKNLYEFWDTKITDALNEEIKENETLVNLASNEYFKAMKPRLLQARVITPVFKDFKNGQYKNIMVYAKRARGLMTRFAVNHQLTDVEKLKTFAVEGYGYDEKLSTEDEWVFTR